MDDVGIGELDERHDQTSSTNASYRTSPGNIQRSFFTRETLTTTTAHQTTQQRTQCDWILSTIWRVGHALFGRPTPLSVVASFAKRSPNPAAHEVQHYLSIDTGASLRGRSPFAGGGAPRERRGRLPFVTGHGQKLADAGSSASRCRGATCDDGIKNRDTSKRTRPLTSTLAPAPSAASTAASTLAPPPRPPRMPFQRLQRRQGRLECRFNACNADEAASTPVSTLAGPTGCLDAISTLAGPTRRLDGRFNAGRPTRPPRRFNACTARAASTADKAASTAISTLAPPPKPFQRLQGRQGRLDAYFNACTADKAASTAVSTLAGPTRQPRRPFQRLQGRQGRLDGRFNACRADKAASTAVSTLGMRSTILELGRDPPGRAGGLANARLHRLEGSRIPKPLTLGSPAA